MVLGDLGAEIIKIEDSVRGDDVRHIPPLRGGESHYFLSINRNKRSVALNLKEQAGRDVVLDLSEHCDVLVENYRPGVAKAMGLGYEEIAGRNPGIIYCSISGFGQSGPWSDRPAFDLIIQALSGVMSVTGEPGRPPMRMGLPMGDLSAGLFSTIGILSALMAKRESGVGQHIDVAMLDATLGLLGYLSGQYFMTGESAAQVGASHPHLVPYGVFRASNGYIVVAVLTESIWPRLCRALGRDDLANDPRYDRNANRLERRDEVDAIIQRALLADTVDVWCRRLHAANVPCAPILSVGEALENEHVTVRGLVEAVDHVALGRIRTLGPVIRLSGSEKAGTRPPPLLGQDSDAVLREIVNYSPERIAELERNGVLVNARQGKGAGHGRPG